MMTSPRNASMEAMRSRARLRCAIVGFASNGMPTDDTIVEWRGDCTGSSIRFSGVQGCGSDASAQNKDAEC